MWQKRRQYNQIAWSSDLHAAPYKNPNEICFSVCSAENFRRTSRHSPLIKIFAQVESVSNVRFARRSSAYTSRATLQRVVLWWIGLQRVTLWGIVLQRVTLRCTTLWSVTLRWTTIWLVTPQRVLQRTQRTQRNVWNTAHAREFADHLNLSRFYDKIRPIRGAERVAWVPNSFFGS